MSGTLNLRIAVRAAKTFTWSATAVCDTVNSPRGSGKVGLALCYLDLLLLTLCLLTGNTMAACVIIAERAASIAVADLMSFSGLVFRMGGCSLISPVIITMEISAVAIETVDCRLISTPHMFLPL